MTAAARTGSACRIRRRPFPGARGVYSVSNVDGISGNTRSGASLDTPVNMDSVAEVKVLLNNYQAEYGKGAAGVINVITKGGTQNFHGLGYYYMRNEALNANNFFNNAAGAPRGPYRYKTMGGNIGGPIYIPKHFNTEQEQAVLLLRAGVPAAHRSAGSALLHGADGGRAQRRLQSIGGCDQRFPLFRGEDR